MELRDFLRRERTARGWTLRAVAQALGVNHTAVAQWERGDTKPKLANLVDICNLFGVSIGGFVGPGSAYAGQLVDDPEEIALLAHWRAIPAEQRPLLLRMIEGARRPVVADKDVPEPPRHRNHDG